MFVNGRDARKDLLVSMTASTLVTQFSLHDSLLMLIGAPDDIRPFILQNLRQTYVQDAKRHSAGWMRSM